MKMKTILFTIALCANAFTYFSEFSEEETTSQYVTLEPTKRTLHWLHWCLQYAERGMNDPELIQNHDLYVQLLKQHIKKLEKKSNITDLISEYKWKKGRLDLQAGALSLLLAYAAHKITGMESVIKAGHDGYYTAAYVLSLFATPFIFVDAIINISKSCSYAEQLYAKLKRDTDALTLLEKQ